MDPLGITASFLSIAIVALDVGRTLYQVKDLSSEGRAFQKELESLEKVPSQTDPDQPKDIRDERYLRHGSLHFQFLGEIKPERQLLFLGQEEGYALSAYRSWWEPLGLLATKTVIPSLQYVLLGILHATRFGYAASKGIGPYRDVDTQFPSPFRHSWVVESCIWGLLFVTIVSNISILFCLGWGYRMQGMRTLLCWTTFAAMIMARFWIQSGGSLETCALVALPFGVSVGMSCTRLQQAMAKKYHCRWEPSPKQDICIEKGLPHSATTV